VARFAGAPPAEAALKTRSLPDFDRDFKIFAADAETHAAHRRRADRIESDRDAHISFGRANAVGWIEPHPADVRDKSFRPGVAGLLIDPSIRHLQIAGDVARRNVEMMPAAIKM